jgi:deazaflavin-dependent oxidoreductase (nitroreductase family)
MSYMNNIVQPNLLQKTVQRLAALAPVAALLVPLLHRMDRLVLRLSGGRTTALGLLAGLPLITLTTIGAKSGQLRSVPLVGIPDGERLILVASNFGQAHHPAWYHNLVKHPHAAVTIDGATRDYTAREVAGEEYDRCWQLAVSLYAGYAAYKARTGGRQIPILVLTPEPGKTR